ncbi:hypothetical protein CDAR_19401 [Caerostris darwini]|uniref:Uncharacterized protein n=1 Tax=Caerostris darwini TaxID=1538125 RepID=A0AAV4WE74_9ARAC|nr:hypothetical protein CDAR_19401 [Caerostris darwini]
MYPNPVAVQHTSHNNVPMRIVDSKLGRNLCLFVIVAVYFGIVMYFSLNYSIPDKTGPFRITYNVMAVISIAFAICLVVCMVILYPRRDRILHGMLRLWTSIRDPQRPDQRPEDIELQESLIPETVRRFLNFGSRRRPQVVSNQEELRPEPPHHEPRVELLMEQPGDELRPESPHDEPQVDLVMEQPGDELQQKQPELEQPSAAEQQSPTNPILSPTQSSSMEQLNPQLNGRRYFSRYGNVPKRF